MSWVDIFWNVMESKIFSVVLVNIVFDVVNLNFIFFFLLVSKNVWLNLEEEVSVEVKVCYLFSIW